ncbi:MAG: type IV toxin-antitoxin system AbiEi family antitoxin, partial [Acidimicrobiia bacterium]
TYLFPGAPPTWHQAVVIAVTAAGARSAASHQTAAYLHGLTDRRPSKIEVVTPRWRRSRAVDFTVHESLDLRPDHVMESGGIRLTKPIRTVVDLGASAPWLVEPALDAGLRQRLFTLPDAAAFVGRVAKRGRRGVGVIRPFIEQRVLWDGVTESELEDLLRRVWDDRQPSLVPQYIITTPDEEFVCRTDFAFVEHKIRIELDSEAFHMDRTTFRRDRVIQNQTELIGWRTFRYTWWDLTARPLEVVAEIEAALRESPFMRP